MRIIGKESGDYFNVEHENCGGSVHITYLGMDPAVPRFRFECRKCKEKDEYKMQWQLWADLPEKAAK